MDIQRHIATGDRDALDVGQTAHRGKECHKPKETIPICALCSGAHPAN